MKLYTEEQVNKAMLDYIQGIPRIDIFNSLTPIELPSDEEIKKYADQVMPDAEKIGGMNYSAYRGIKAGAKWMREQILNQNK